MGSSGAGKTSLLNLLSNRLATTNNAKLTGSITANGYPIKDVEFAKFTGYVTQDDILYETMTPRECIRFSAFMKIGLRGERLDLKVDQIIDELGLTPVADNIIGSVMIKGLSGGQKKRVNIAIETITDPSILFLDEPTSGLDSNTSVVVIELLKE